METGNRLAKMTSERERAEFQKYWDALPGWERLASLVSTGRAIWRAASRKERKRCVELAQTYIDESTQLNRLLSALDEETL